MINLYFKAIENIEKVKGEVFNIGGIMENSFSLIELFNFLENMLDIKLEYKKLPLMKSDQKVFLSDIIKVKNLICWQPNVFKEERIKRMID